MRGLGERLRARARELELSDAEVARRAGLSERRYGNYVLGRREPDLATLVRICRTLAITPNELLAWSDEPKQGKRGLLLKQAQSAVTGLSDRDLRLAVALLRALSADRRGNVPT